MPLQRVLPILAQVISQLHPPLESCMKNSRSSLVSHRKGYQPLRSHGLNNSCCFILLVQLGHRSPGLLGVSCGCCMGGWGWCHLGAALRCWDSWAYFLLHVVSGPILFSVGADSSGQRDFLHSILGLPKASIPRRRGRNY